MEFFQFQKFVIDLCNSSGLLLETHPHHILALSSVVLLKPGQHHSELLEFFVTEESKMLRHNVLSVLAGDKYEDIKYEQTKTYFSCNKITKETKESKANFNKSQRPDPMISSISQKHFGYSKGFGEVKVAESINNKYGLVRGLVRLSTFTKESIDLNNMKCNLFFQAIVNIFMQLKEIK